MSQDWKVESINARWISHVPFTCVVNFGLGLSGLPTGLSEAFPGPLDTWESFKHEQTCANWSFMSCDVVLLAAKVAIRTCSRRNEVIVQLGRAQENSQVSTMLRVHWGLFSRGSLVMEGLLMIWPHHPGYFPASLPASVESDPLYLSVVSGHWRSAGKDFSKVLLIFEIKLWTAIHEQRMTKSLQSIF